MRNGGSVPDADGTTKILRPTKDDVDKLLKRDRVGVPEPGEVTWDKPAPEGPPEGAIPPPDEDLAPLHRYFGGIIGPEAILLDMCMDRSIEIVRNNISARSAGIDNYAEGNPTHPVHICSIAGPLAVELYRQCIDDVKKNPEPYTKAISDCQALRDAKTSKIITP
jgi:hypothetical protein